VLWYLPGRQDGEWRDQMKELNALAAKLSERTRAQQIVLADRTATPAAKRAALDMLREEKAQIARLGVTMVLSPNHRKRAF
jgi:hypothetical protein